MNISKLMNPGWGQALPALLLLLATVCFVYSDTLLTMIGLWQSSETFAHAFIVPPISLWLIWRQREALLAQQPRPNAWFLLPMACIALLWLLGDLVAVNSVTQLALVALLVLSVPLILGVQASQRIAFPLGFLFFAVPLGEFMMPQLMDWTADFTVLALRLTGIPVFREGNQFVIPSGNWSVVEACSGIRYLIASLMVGTLFGYLNYRSIYRRWAFVAVSIVVPLVANWLRAYFIVLLGHYSGNKLAVGVDHLIYGWLFFGVVMVLMFMVGARWSDAPQQAAEEIRVMPAPSIAASTRAAWQIALLGVVVLLLPQFTLWSLTQADRSGEPELKPFTLLAAGWQPTPQPWVDWAPEFQNPSVTLNQSFVKDGAEVGLFIGYYRHQSSERKLVSSSNALVRTSNKHWAQVSRGSLQLPLADQTAMRLSSADLRGSGAADAIALHRLLVWHLYWVNGTWTNSDMLAKAYGAWYRLMGRGDDGAVLTFYTERGAAESGQATLALFVRENLALIEEQLRRVRGKP
jgi:exosortase A